MKVIISYRKETCILTAKFKGKHEVIVDSLAAENFVSLICAEDNMLNFLHRTTSAVLNFISS